MTTEGTHPCALCRETAEWCDGELDILPGLAHDVMLVQSQPLAPLLDCLPDDTADAAGADSGLRPEQ